MTNIQQLIFSAFFVFSSVKQKQAIKFITI